MNEKELENFSPKLAELKALVESTKSINADDLEDPKQLKIVKESRIQLKNARVAIEKAGKALREDALKFQKAVIAKEKELIAIIEPEEIRLESIEDEAKKIGIRKARIEALPYRKERIARIGKYAKPASDEEIIEMDPNEFEAHINAVNSSALAEERQEMDKNRLIEDARIKAEQDKKQAELDLQQKKLDEEARKIQQQKDIAAAEEKARIETADRMKREQEEKDRKDKEKRDSEAKAAADKIAAEKAEAKRKEKERIQKEADEKAELKRQDDERKKREKEAAEKRDWLIWSIEHNQWWDENETGYVGKKSEAGRYTFEDACRIVKDANQKEDRPNEAMVKV